MINRIFVSIVALVCASFVFAGEEVNRSAPLEQESRVTIENTRGKIQVIGWEKAEIQVLGTLDDLAKKLAFDVRKDRAHIEVEMPRRVEEGEGSNLTIYVPFQAKVLLQNFLLETQKDSSLGDPAEIEKQIVEVDKKIEEHEQKAAERDAGLAAEREKAQKAQQEADEAKARIEEVENQLGPQGTDPGAANRRTGRLMLGLGVVAGVGAAAGGILFMLERNKFEDALVDNEEEFSQIGCVDPSDNVHCDALNTQAGALDRNAVKANQLSLGIGLGAGIVGAALVGTGIGLMVKGHKRTKKWKGGSDVAIAPTRNGFVVSGRF